MGYEYSFIFSLPLHTPQLEKLLHYLQTPHPWTLLSAAPGDTNYVVRYAYAASESFSWDEDFLVEVSNQQVYLLLHTATADQEARVLAWLQQGAVELELAGLLVEL